MLNTLSGRLATLFTAMFVVLGALLVGMSQHMPELRQVITLGAELLVAAITFALLTALLVFNLLTRRLHLLAQEIDAFRAGGFTQPTRLAWARADGDEIHRLAHAFGELSAHIAHQIDALQQHDVQRRELLANVSHDLRTPLTLMQGYLETLLLRHGRMSRSEERSCLEVATRHAERLGRLVADLFELAKLDGPEDRLPPEVFSAAELAQDVVQKFALHAQSRRLHIDARLLPGADGGAPVQGDIGLVERALENLVENALRHTPEGGSVGLAVGCSRNRVRISVSDTGCGITQDSLPHVFDRYFQAPRVEGPADHCASERDGGRPKHHAGLGLAITRRIVALHGGTIGVDSTVGQGTVFSIELPLATAASGGSP
jgi:signal transduction histidine kinase